MHSDDGITILSKDVYQPDECVEGNKTWKVLQDEDGLQIVTHIGPALTVFVVFGVLFLIFWWVIGLWARGWEMFWFLLIGTAIGVAGLSFFCYALIAYAREGNLVEPAGPLKLRLPRHDVVLSYDEIKAILMADGESAEYRHRATQVLIQTRKTDGGPTTFPIITCAYRKYAEEVAEALTFEIGAPIIRCEGRKKVR